MWNFDNLLSIAITIVLVAAAVFFTEWRRSRKESKLIEIQSRQIEAQAKQIDRMIELTTEKLTEFIESGLKIFNNISKMIKKSQDYRFRTDQKEKKSKENKKEKESKETTD